MRIDIHVVLSLSERERGHASKSVDVRGRPPGPLYAIPYIGSFSFYGSGSFIGCSETKPNWLTGFFRVKRSFFYADDSTTITLTHGVFSGSMDHNNVLELVFSDAAHQHYAQPEVVLGYYRP